MFSLLFINPLSVMLSLSTLFGVVIHDTKIDKLTIAAVSVTTAAVSYEASVKLAAVNDLHTHSERMSISEMVRAANNQAPRTQPRTNEDKKYRLQKNVVRGNHGFDSYSLPLS